MIALKDRDRVVAGRYRLVKALGTGGMGTVWLAHDDLLHRQVAMKEVSPPSEMSASGREILRQRTLREARTAARLNHPNVVTIFDVVNDGGQPWIVMELVSARSLRDIVEEDGPLPPQQAARVGLQVLAALRAAHALGIVHRDVKPGNVLIETDGRAVLADFGIARAQDSSTITTSGVIVGSPSYIAPERARGERGGPESDLWSLGATIYSAVEGRPPYERAGALATLTALVTQDPDPPVRSGPLWPVISGLLNRDPARRLGAADAQLMLRRIAEADHVLNTSPLAAGGDSASSGTADPAGRLEHAEWVTAFHPYVPQPAAPLHREGAAAAPSSAVSEDVTPTPPTGFPAVSAAASSTEVPDSGIAPPDDAASGSGSAEPGAGSAEVRPIAASGSGSAEPGTGSAEPGAGSAGVRPVAASGSGSAEPGAGSAEPGAGSAEPGAGSAEPAAGIGDVVAGGQGSRPRHTEGSGPKLVAGSPPVQQAAPVRVGTRELSSARPSPPGRARTTIDNTLIPGIAGRPTSKPGPGDGRSPKRRRLIWMVTAVAVLMAAAGALVALNTSGRHISGHHAALAPTRPGHSAKRPAVSKSPAPGPSYSSGSTPTPSQPSFGVHAAVPAGYYRYFDPTGFSIALPDGWAVSRQGTYVYVIPPSGGSFLIIDQTDHPKPDPLADWQQQEANRIGTYPGYHRIRLQAIYYPQAEKAADWEWTYYKGGVLTHVLNRNILANSSHAYALYWSTPQSAWDADFHIFEVFARTFQPAAPRASGS